MHELFTQAIDHIVFFRFEILAAVLLAGGELIRRRHGSNKVVAAFIDLMSKHVIEQMEAEENKPMNQRDSRRKKVQREVRRGIAKQARKANRGKSKGQKRSAK